MPGITGLVAAISIDVNAELVAKHLPPLTDGAIVIGRVRWDENTTPPRVVMIPKSSRFAAREQYKGWPLSPQNAQNPGAPLRSVTVTQFGGSYSGGTTVSIAAPPLGTTATAVPVLNNGALKAIALTNGGSGYIAPPVVSVNDSTGSGASAVANVGPAPDQLIQLLQRSLFTDIITFEVYCWGVTGTDIPPIKTSPDTDFDFTQLLYQQVIASAHAVAPGSVLPTVGHWMEADEDTTQVDLLGHGYVFEVEIRTPVLADPLSFVPIGTQATLTLTLQPPGGGTPEQG